jgi:ABC-2 type transport system ATP-binding protein
VELTVEHLSKTYAGGVRALDDVSLTIPPGVFGLLGPNGAGKTTLMQTLATLQVPDAGRVRLGTTDALSSTREMRQRLGYLPQDFGVYPNASARELLDYLAQLKGFVATAIRQRHVNELLSLVNLTAVAHRAVDTFSGGMRQRFGVAQALIGWPDLLIVDEPTAGLDPAERNRFHELLASIGENRIVILSTHIVEDVTNLCERLAILRSGRVVAQGTPAALTDAWRGRLWSRDVSRDEVDRIRHTVAVVGSRLAGRRMLLTAVADTAPAGFARHEPSLEDVYFASVLDRQPS